MVIDMLVNAHWLKKNINKKNVKVLDSSWYLPNSKRDAKKEYKNMRILGAIFFDIDDICNKKSKLPHMLPSQKYFEKKISHLGINSNDILVVYCKEGVLSSPRVWWMFKYFGHKKVFVLNGGLKAWMLVNGIIKCGPVNIKKTRYKVGRINFSSNSSYEEITRKKKKENIHILDARPIRRFLELDPEPRENIGRGKIEDSLSVDFSLIDTNGFFKSKRKIRKIYNNILERDYKIICSCGSGVSACTLALSLSYIGNNNWSVYDGSWTEWHLKTKS